MSDTEFADNTSLDVADHSDEELFEAADFAEPETTEEAEDGAVSEGQTAEAAEKPAESGKNPPVQEGEDVVPPLQMKFDGRSFQISGAAAKELSEATGIPLEGLSTIIQKGMNYDSAMERTPLHKTMEKFARANGMDLRQYQEYLEKNSGEAMIQGEMRSIREKYPDLDAAIARELAEGRLAKRQNADYQSQREKMINDLREQEREKEEKLRPFREFSQKYPDVKSFTDEEKALMQSGMSPTAAHEVALERAKQSEEITRLQGLLAQAEQKAKNEAQSPGSLSENSGEPETDPFLQGLGF